MFCTAQVEGTNLLKPGMTRDACRGPHWKSGTRAWRSSLPPASSRKYPSLTLTGALGEAITYSLNLRARRKEFLHYPVLEPLNNLAKNSMRGIAFLRKDWIHLGHQKAGPLRAAILSIAGTYRRLSLPMRECLLDVLPGTADRNEREVAVLILPARK